MDKSTDSSNTSGGGPNHGSSSGDTPMRDISLGCGPSSSSASAAASNNSASTSAGGASTSSVAIPLPLGAPLPVTLQCAPATSCARSTLMQPINLNISTTTGGNFGVTVDPQISVENLKKIIAKKLKVAKDRICLLHREKELQDGTLKDNSLMDGSKIILIPNVETGLLAQRPENTVMQALESLNDSQVNDFLSGKTPLNLSMRLGDHMMLIQLQLSTVNPVNGTSINGSSCNSSRTRSSSQRSRAAAGAAVAAAAAAHHHSHSHHHHHHHHPNVGATATTSASGLSSSSAAASAARKMDTDRPSTVSRIHTTAAGPSSSSAGSSATTAIKSSDLSSFLSKRDYESLQNIVKSIAMAQPARLVAPIVTSNHSTNVAPTAHVQHTLTTPSMSAATICPIIAHSQALRTLTPVPSSSSSSAASGFHRPSEASLLEQSPIKSLSNLVSSPIKTTAIKNIPIANGSNSSSASNTTNNSNNHTSLTSNGISTSSSVAVSAAAAASAVAACQDPISAKLTSCLCTRLNGGSNNMVAVNKNCIESACVSRHNVNGDHHYAAGSQPRTVMLTSTPNNNYKTCVAAAPSAVTTLLHKTANNPITRSKHRHHHHHHHHHHHYHNNNNGNGVNNSNSSSSGSTNSGTSLVVRPKAPLSPRCASVASMASSSNDSGFASDDSTALASTSTTVVASPKSTTATALLPPQTTTVPAPVAAVTSSAATSSSPVELDDSGLPVSDTRTLAEASRNLTQTLRKLSKEVFTNKIDLSGGDEAPRKSGSGAVIESMKNHGKGIYSGTFSGTLNPALQDRYGRPKRDISTVIHILNDLLSATPQYSRGARISFEAPSTSAAAATAASSGSVHSTRSKQLSVKHHQHSCVKCIKTQAHSHSSTTTTSNSSTVCAYGECNGHYVSKSQAKSNYACCQDLSTTGHASAASSNPSESSERHVCACRYRIVGETGEREREHMCQKCHVDQDNLKTKSKLDQLRLVMQQRKQKREARKLKGAPYGTRLVGIATANSVSTAVVGSVTAGGVNGLNATTTAPHSSNSNTTPLSTVPTQATTNNTNNTNNNSSNSSEVSPNHIVEEVDTAA